VPELPEVETVRRSLLPVVGRRVVTVRVPQPLLRWPLPDDFAARLRGQVIKTIRRLGKYLLFDLCGGETLLVHLGMSGTFVLRAPNTALGVHDHVALTLDDRTGLVFNDPRRFGFMRIGLPQDFDVLQRLGPDALSETVSADRLYALTRKRKRPVKNLLMDQAVLGGLGNIYANEILFLAGVRPGRRAGRLTRREVEAVLDATRVVLRRAIRDGGSSIADYRDGRGRPGYFQLRLHVYGRTGEPCLTCRSPVRRVVHSGRSSFYCPSCQR
jgi:formamidopyrimidine-DNA glycosylase